MREGARRRKTKTIVGRLVQCFRQDKLSKTRFRAIGAGTRFFIAEPVRNFIIKLRRGVILSRHRARREIFGISAPRGIDFTPALLYNRAMSEGTKKIVSEKERLDKHPNVIGQIPPHSEEAERGLLCCMMIDANVPMEVVHQLDPEDFYYESNGLIYSAMRRIWNDNRPIDLVTVTTELDGMGALKKAGGARYISELSGYLATSANFKAHLDIVRKDAQLRRLMNAANEVLKMCYASSDAQETLQFAERAVNDVAESQGIHALRPFDEAVNEAVADFDAVCRDPKAKKGLQTGFRDLDYLLGGLGAGDLVIIAARPGQGKTSIGMNIVSNVATAHLTEDGTPRKTETPAVCAIFSLEMPASQLAKRMLCSLAHVDFSRMSKGEIKSADEWRRITNARSALCASKIFIDDLSLTTPMDILSKCRRLKREQKRLDLVMVDYLTLMSSGKRVENRQQEVSEISRMMKLAAKELGVPILLLSQLSRESEKNKRAPQMSDLRESGAIEQDADVILFIYRKTDKEGQPVDTTSPKIIVGKHRNGPLGEVEMRWMGEYVSFADKDSSDPVPAPADDKTEAKGIGAVLVADDSDETAGL